MSFKEGKKKKTTTLLIKVQISVLEERELTSFPEHRVFSPTNTDNNKNENTVWPDPALSIFSHPSWCVRMCMREREREEERETISLGWQN